VLIGYRTRLAAVVAVLCLLSLQTRNPFVLNSGDVLLRVFGLFLALAPAGAAFRRPLAPAGLPVLGIPKQGSLGASPHATPAKRLYLFAVWAKLWGSTWNDGTAVSYVLRVEELSRIDLPAWPTQSVAVSNALTFGTLATEVALATLVWNRRARPWVMALGVVMHLLIDFAIMVGFFSFVVFVGYLAFVPSDTMTRRILAARDGLRRLPLALSQRPNRSRFSPAPEAMPIDTQLYGTSTPTSPRATAPRGSSPFVRPLRQHLG
jgi:hypothetical protein